MGARWDSVPTRVHLLVGPAYHSGPAAFAQTHLALGATVVIMPRWDAESCLALIQRHRVTNTHMVPSNFIRILDLDPKIRESYDLSSLQVVLHAAAPCPVPVKRAFMDLVGAEKVFEYFGATEGGWALPSRPRSGSSIREAWAGRSVGNEIVILDDEGRVLGPGEVGLVYVRPATAAFRYHRDDEKTSAAFRDGRFTVGDMGYLDEDGYLFLTDRRADMVITGGVNVYPREIEDVLYLHPDVADCAVFGVPDERWGEALKAVGPTPRRRHPDRRRRRGLVPRADGRLQASPAGWSSSTSCPAIPTARSPSTACGPLNLDLARLRGSCVAVNPVGAGG